MPKISKKPEIKVVTNIKLEQNPAQAQVRSWSLFWQKIISEVKAGDR